MEGQLGRSPYYRCGFLESHYWFVGAMTSLVTASRKSNRQSFPAAMIG
jgi:hypothetical protein